MISRWTNLSANPSGATFTTLYRIHCADFWKSRHEIFMNLENRVVRSFPDGARTWRTTIIGLRFVARFPGPQPLPGYSIPQSTAIRSTGLTWGPPRRVSSARHPVRQGQHAVQVPPTYQIRRGCASDYHHAWAAASAEPHRPESDALKSPPRHRRRLGWSSLPPIDLWPASARLHESAPWFARFARAARD